MSPQPQKPAVLFVCLGNICRSPLAEGAFRAEADRLGLDVAVDSAGTGGWHVGEPPDRRAQAVARRYGVDIGQCRARQVGRDDFSRFTHVVALDESVLVTLRRIRPRDATAEIRLLLDYVDGRAGEGVADPYYGGDDGFEITWADVTSGAAALARRIAGG
ncbi:low molecular weight protein-tyrosine-phosphatase [Rhodoplanes sp. SY1]|uniref:low molecular weight protein-tyrosine-phosphatase n=1 Tax=Rhodoplanes sp. SY1 TaxID=3166646 RepID=UPI0038B653BB